MSKAAEFNSTITERLIASLGGVTQSNLTHITAEYKQQRANATKRAYEAGLEDGNDETPPGSTGLRTFGYRNLGDTRNVIGRNKHYNKAWNLLHESPVAAWSVETKRNHIIGRNTAPESADEDVNEVVTEFWQANNMPEHSDNFTLELFAFGEQVYPVGVDDSAGRVEIGYISPGEIERIITEPSNGLIHAAVVCKPLDQVSTDSPWLKDDNKHRVYRIIRPANAKSNRPLDDDNDGLLIDHTQAEYADWEAAMLSHYELSDYTGSCFYRPVNNTSDLPRGFSDWLQVEDWIYGAEDVLTTLIEREEFAGFFFMDVTLRGINASTPAEAHEAVQEWLALRGRKPPKKGNINVHTESEEWNLIAPELGQEASIAVFRALLGFILGGMGFPVHWYGFGDDANRATAVAQGGPTTKNLEHDQGVVKAMFLNMCTFARDQAIISDRIGRDSQDAVVDLPMPEIRPVDLTMIMQSLAQLVPSAETAVNAGWIQTETAAKAVHKVLDSAGIDTADVNEEMSQDNAVAVQAINGQVSAETT